MVEETREALLVVNSPLLKSSRLCSPVVFELSCGIVGDSMFDEFRPVHRRHPPHRFTPTETSYHVSPRHGHYWNQAPLIRCPALGIVMTHRPSLARTAGD